MVNFVVWLVVGAIIGWLASQLMGQSEGLLLNVVVGIVGAFLAGLVLTPLLGSARSTRATSACRRCSFRW